MQWFRAPAGIYSCILIQGTLEEKVIHRLFWATLPLAWFATSHFVSISIEMAVAYVFIFLLLKARTYLSKILSLNLNYFLKLAPALPRLMFALSFLNFRTYFVANFSLHVMHQSFVTTAPPSPPPPPPTPPTGNSGDNDFSSITALLKALYCGDLLRVKALLFILVNSMGVYLCNTTSSALTRHCGGTRKVTTPHISPAIPRPSP